MMKAIVSAVPNSKLLNIVITVIDEKNIISNIIARNRNGFEISQMNKDIPYHRAVATPVTSHTPTLE